jgi:hypothetical protein
MSALSALPLTLWSCIALSQDPLVRECESTATSDTDHAACSRLEQCISNCGGDESCVSSCTTPGRNAGVPPPPPRVRTTDVPEPLPLPANGKSKDHNALCKELYDFRDHQLFKLWVAEQSKYTAKTEGSAALVKIRNDTEHLMDNTWWAKSSGATIAIEIKGIADATTDVIGIFVPEEAPLVHRAEKIAQRLTEGVGVLVTYAEENAKAASIDAGMTLFARYGGQLASATRLLYDSAQYAKTKEEAQAYRDVVQDQVQRINQTLMKLDEQRTDAVRKGDAYQQIVRSIDLFCSSTGPSSPPP